MKKSMDRYTQYMDINIILESLFNIFQIRDLKKNQFWKLFYSL